MLNYRFALDSVIEYAEKQFENTRLSAGLDTISDEKCFSRHCMSDEEVLKIILDTLCPANTKLTILSDCKEQITAIDLANSSLIIRISLSKTTVTVETISDSRVVHKLDPFFDPAPVRIKWVYNTNGQSVYIPVDTTNLPSESFYPGLTVPLHTYYDNFISSRSNILLLIGAPGTGKTSFIKGFLAHTQSDAVVSYDAAILEQDAIFAEFMCSHGRQNILILEDADNFLISRTKTAGNNSVMHKFLNVGDGLLSTRRKKIIFTTNLPSTRDID